MGTNAFQPFAPTNTGTNLLTDAAYLAASDRVNGNQPGIASSALNNKLGRQTSLVAMAVAQFIADAQATNVDDTLTYAQLLALLQASIGPGRRARFTANGSWVCPPGITTVFATAAGGGGGGGATLAATAPPNIVSGAGGGGSGVTCYKMPLTVVPGTTYPVTVGAPGAGGSIGSSGSAGGATQLGTAGAVLNLPGGAGGGVGSGGTTASAWAGGGGGANVGGGTAGTITGMAGGDAADVTASIGSLSGAGAGNLFGGGAPAKRVQSNVCQAGFAAVNYGCGGSGAAGMYNGSASHAGAAGGGGAQGILILEW